MMFFLSCIRQAANSFEQYRMVGVRLASAHFNPIGFASDSLFSQGGESCAGGRAARRYRSIRGTRSGRTKRQRQRDCANSREPRGRLGLDHQLHRVVAHGSGPRGLRCPGNGAGSILAKNSPCNELFMVRAQIDLRNPGLLRSALEGDNRTRRRRLADLTRFVGTQERWRLYHRALQRRFGARLLGAALDRSIGAAQRSAQNVTSAALPC
jgi:hypothetical protein